MKTARTISGWIALLALCFAVQLQADDSSLIYRLSVEAIWAAAEFAILLAIYRCGDWPGLCSLAFGAAIIAVHAVSFYAAQDCVTRYGIEPNYWVRYTCWPLAMPLHVLIALGGIALCFKPAKA